MSESMLTTLKALKDVHGIQGSFVLNEQGELLAKEMPSLFDGGMLTELGPRMERMSESFSMLGDELESCLIRFSDHLLCIRKFAKGGTLCILGDRTVNLSALKMAVNLADRRLAGEIDSAQPMTAAASANEAPAAPAVQAAPAAQSARKPPRYYRGALIEE